MAETRPPLLQRGPRRIAVLAVPLLALLVLAAVVASGALSDDDVDGGGATEATTDGGDSDATGAVGTDAGATGDRPSGDSSAEVDAAAEAERVVNPDIVAPEELPLEAEVVGTSGLADGDVVTIRVTADDDSEIYALEARLCAGDASIESDSDIRPTRTGKCVLEPLSPQSDAFVEHFNEPPYDVAETTFRVGIGTSTYETQEGETVSVTCDRDHPCLLAVKFQVPYGYGFRTYPLEFR